MSDAIQAMKETPATTRMHSQGGFVENAEAVAFGTYVGIILWKLSQGFNGVWTYDLVIPVWHSNKLSYEATDVGARHLWVPMSPSGMNVKLHIKYFISWTVDVEIK